MTGFCLSVFFLEVIEDVTHAQTVARHLIRIGRTNALTGGTYLVLTLLGLVGCIEHTMGGHDEMGLLGDMQTGMQIMTAGLQCLRLVHKQVGRQHHTVTDDVDLSTLEDSRWNGTQHILLALELKRMTSIRTALETGYHIVLRGQYIDHLTFSFVAPLQTQQDIYFTFVHNTLFICF